MPGAVGAVVVPRTSVSGGHGDPALKWEVRGQGASLPHLVAWAVGPPTGVRKGSQELRRRLIFADLTRSEKNPQASRPSDPFTVDQSTRYLRTKLGAVWD
jgi:hypothetical protein